MAREPVSQDSQTMSWLDLLQFAGGGLRGHRGCSASNIRAEQL